MPVYSAKTKIILKDESSKGPESLIYAELGLSNGTGTNIIENELAILQSRALMTDVVKSLSLNIQYFVEGQFNTAEIYRNIPFTLQVLRMEESLLKKLGGADFEVSKSPSGQFSIYNLGTGKTYLTEAGEPVDLGFVNVVLSNSSNKENFTGSVIVRFSEVEKIAGQYINRIRFIQKDKGSNLIQLELTDPIREKARDILDQLVLEYNRSAIEDKNLIAGNTAKFINERLEIINDELDSVETGKETFKEENKLTDIQAESQMFLQTASEYNQRRQEVGTQLELANAMLEYISSNPKSDLLPTNLGLTESGVNGQIDDYNELVLQRNRLLSGSSEKNPVVIKLNSRLEQIKGNIVQSLNRMRSNLRIGQEELNRQASSIGSKIFAVPGKERQYRGIERQQNIKETLYLFLLQKREENSLSMAVMEPKAKIVDRAYYSNSPISPNSRSIYLGTFILGLFVPFSVIYARGMLDNKVRKRSDIENVFPDVALVGEIPKIVEKQKFIALNDRSVLAESYRMLSTNLQFMMVNSKDKVSGKVLLVTSTIKGEGKTFTAVNLAITLANTSKKVILIAADLRSPKVNTISEPNQKEGISDYLVQEDLSLSELIVKSNVHSSLDLLKSGTIPPNPYELLKAKKVQEMFVELKSRYDYVIVDTAPLMLVADTFLLTPFADVILYVIRAGVTAKELLEFAQQARAKGQLASLGFVLNNLQNINLGYGNKYGYGYGLKEKSFWSFKKGAPAYN